MPRVPLQVWLVLTVAAAGVLALSLGDWSQRRVVAISEEKKEQPPVRQPALRLGGKQFRHQLAGNALVFSADGKSLFSGGTDGAIREWEVETGKVMWTFDGHNGPVYTLALQPGGKQMASGGKDGTVRLWEVTGGKETRRVTAHADGVWSVAYSPDGKTVVSGGFRDSAARLWDAATGMEAGRLTVRVHPDLDLDPHRLTVAYSPDGRTIATAGYRDKIRLWDAVDRTELRSIWGTRNPVLCFSPDGRFLLGEAPFGLTLWEAATAKELARFADSKGLADAAAFAPDGKRFAVVGLAGTAEVWDVATGKVAFTLPGHLHTVKAVAFSPDGKLIATGGDEGVVRLFDAATGRQLRPPDGHQGRVSCLAVTPDGKHLISGGWDRTVRLWELPSGKPVRTLTWEPGEGLWNRRATVNSISLSGDGKRMASSDFDGPVRIWEVETGRQIRTIEREQPGAGAIVLTRDGNRLLLGGMDGALGIWDVNTGQMLRKFERGGGVRRLAIARDEKVFACPGYISPADVELRSLETGNVLTRLAFTPDIPDGPVVSGETLFAFSPDGKTLAAAEDLDRKTRRPLRLFDGATGKELLAFGDGGRITAVAFSPNGELVAAADEGAIGLWDASTGERKDWFGTGQWTVRTLAFSVDGKTLFSGGDDGTVCGWALAP